MEEVYSYLIENGMFYFNSVESWVRDKCRVVPCNLVEMNPETLYEIDTENDFTTERISEGGLCSQNCLFETDGSVYMVHKER